MFKAIIVLVALLIPSYTFANDNSDLAQSALEQKIINCDGTLLATDYTVRYDHITLSHGDRFSSITLSHNTYSCSGTEEKGDKCVPAYTQGAEGSMAILSWKGQYGSSWGRWEATLLRTKDDPVLLVSWAKQGSKGKLTWSLECEVR